MAIAGGVLLSTIISFFLVPPMFLVVTRMGRKEIEPSALLISSDHSYPQRLAS